MSKKDKFLLAVAIFISLSVAISLPMLIKLDNSKGYHAAEPATEKPVDILETTIVAMSSEEEVEECVTEEKLIFAGPTKKPLVAIEEEEKARILLEKQRIAIEEQLQDAEYIQPQPATQDLSSEGEQSLQEDWSVATDTDAAAEEWTPGVYLGCYITTAYHWTGNPCADGVYPELGYTVACNDPNLWHRWVYIDGVGARYVHDRGGMSSYAHLDIYLGDRDSCINWGRRDLNVWLME